jgi:AcrR family transcriptional regulator
MTSPETGGIAPPATARGAATRARLLAAGEEVFDVGFSEGSIVDITWRAGVAPGTFYLYFRSKHELLVSLIRERGHEMRAAMAAAVEEADSGRLERERAGFRAFLEWIGRHPSIYRVVRQADHIDRAVYQEWYRAIAEGYIAGLTSAMAADEIAPVADVETLAYALMGIGDFIGMRFLLWEDAAEAPEEVLETLWTLLERVLAPSAKKRARR